MISVAVLPFLNLSADPENEFFADGITEDVIAQLSKMRSLKVISRTSAMQFKKREMSLGQIAARLGIQPGTVKIHMRHIFEKTGIRGRFGLALSGWRDRQEGMRATA